MCPAGVLQGDGWTSLDVARKARGGPLLHRMGAVPGQHRPSGGVSSWPCCGGVSEPRRSAASRRLRRPKDGKGGGRRANGRTAPGVGARRRDALSPPGPFAVVVLFASAAPCADHPARRRCHTGGRGAPASDAGAVPARLSVSLGRCGTVAARLKAVLQPAVLVDSVGRPCADADGPTGACGWRHFALRHAGGLSFHVRRLRDRQ